MKRPQAQIGATEFKARCLELMQQVHDQKRNEVVVTKRGKPFVKVVPVDAGEGAGAFLGCLKATVEIHRDLTEPTSEDWEALKG